MYLIASIDYGEQFSMDNLRYYAIKDKEDFALQMTPENMEYIQMYNDFEDALKVLQEQATEYPSQHKGSNFILEVEKFTKLVNKKIVHIDLESNTSNDYQLVEYTS